MVRGISQPTLISHDISEYLALKGLIKRALFVITCLCLSSTGFAEVGDPCPQGDECAAGEICAPGRVTDDPAFCTRRCSSDRPCPGEYICEPRGGVSLCNTPITYAQIGEPCSPSCAEGLLCLNDGSEEYCSVACTFPGSCPQGYRCRPGALNACGKVTTSPSIGEPCEEGEMCSGDYECLSLPNRELNYCTYHCEELRCPPFMECDGEGEEARCIHSPYARQLGEECVTEARDLSTVGCVEPLTCERDRDRKRCTKDCSVDVPCPNGFGCVDRPDSPPNLSIGRCMPGVESASGLAPFESTGEETAGDTSTGGAAPYDDTAGNYMPPPSSNAPPPTEESSGCVNHSLPLTPLGLVLIMLSLAHLSQTRRQRDVFTTASADDLSL